MAMEACLKRRRDSNLARLSVALWVWMILQLPVHGFASLAVSQSKQHTTVRLTLPAGTKTRLLNFSPARKILIKLTTALPLDERQLLGHYRLPETSGLQSVRFSRLGANSYLLVVVLVEPLEFKLRSDSGSLTLELMDEALRDPVTAWYRRGLFYHRAGDLGSALKYYRRVVFRDRSHPYAYFKAGQIRMAWGQYRLAEINFKKALRNGCDSTALYLNLARLYLKTGRKSLAEKFQKQYEQHRREVPINATSRPRESKNESLKIQLVQEAPSPVFGAKKNQKAHAAGEDSQSPPEKAMASTQKPAPSTASSKPARHPFPLSGRMLLLIGLAFASLVMGLGVLRWLKMLKSLPLSQKAAEPELDMDAFLAQKMRLLNLASEAQEEPLSEGGEPSPFSGSTGELDFPDEEAFRDASAFGAEAPEDDQFPLGTWGTAASKLQRLARELNVPAGELELAVNLSAGKAALAGVQGDLGEEILYLYRQQVPIAEIARRLNLGQNEVELYLKFREARVVST